MRVVSGKTVRRRMTITRRDKARTPHTRERAGCCRKQRETDRAACASDCSVSGAMKDGSVSNMDAMDVAYAVIHVVHSMGAR